MAPAGENEAEISKAVSQLGQAFGGILRAAFLAAATSAEKAKAARLLERFYSVAQKAHSPAKKASPQNTFNISASRTPERRRLLSHLPSREKFSDLRKYFADRAALRAISHAIGNHIIRHEAQQGIERPASPQQPAPAFK